MGLWKRRTWTTKREERDKEEERNEEQLKEVNPLQFSPCKPTMVSRDLLPLPWALDCNKGLLLSPRFSYFCLGEFTYLANGGRNTVNYIVGSPAIWQAATYLEVIIDDTCYRAMGGNSDHRPLRLWLNINCNFVEPQHTVVTKKFFLPRFNYDKSKVEKYQLALTVSLGNLLLIRLGIWGKTN